MSVAKSFGVCLFLIFLREPGFAPLTLATARRFCPLGSTRQGGWRKRGLPRCSPRGTSGQERVRRLERRTSCMATKCSTPRAPPSPVKEPYLSPLGAAFNFFFG